MNLMPIRPDPTTLREVLRGVRHVLRSGRKSLQDVGAMENLPEPAARLARTLIGDVDDLARGLDGMASRIAGKVIPSNGSPVTPFAEFNAHPQGDAPFAVVAYEALKKAVRHLHARNAFISEAAARAAFQRMRQSAAPGQTAEASAAVLLLAMLDLRVVRAETLTAETRLKAADVDVLASFSVLLWLLADRSDADHDMALLSACELSQALADGILQASASRDVDALRRLFERYAVNV
ncbi:hypothetical protein SAMN05880590_104258 [Rhizobium sp. RU35A]|uniref:hypothetical protein n=1 Tax=Rhizobium sp. RU35A TaxID=1907414 RepID=UPI000955E0A7|nr:hypothetical protein [Rhizobium sp. RU35A]SIQ47309.1 hypothetical protein SAMN05880590_104258 [Rhizobium sp. RU35A]